MDERSIFASWLSRWQLVADGEPIVTAYSSLLPVKRGAALLMLKIATTEEERNGAAVLEWYCGRGAAKVYEREDNAILMERAIGPRSLLTMSRTGADDEATTILCAAIRTLHKAPEPPPAAVPLQIWFRALEFCADATPVIAIARAQARALLSDPRDTVAIHGDIHHRNVLDFGDRGWAAIDPKGVVGERTYDYTVLFFNPDAEIAVDRFQRRVESISREANIDPRRLLAWIGAYGGLSAAWTLGEGGDPRVALAIAAIAANELRA